MGAAASSDPIVTPRIKGLTPSIRAQEERVLLNAWEKTWSLIHQPQQKRAWTNALVDCDRLFRLLPETVVDTLRTRIVPPPSQQQLELLTTRVDPSTLVCLVAMLLLRYNSAVEDMMAGAVAATEDNTDSVIRSVLAGRRDVLLYNYTRDVLVSTLVSPNSFETEVLPRLDAYDAALHTYATFWLEDEHVATTRWTVVESVVNFRLRKLNDNYVWELLQRVLLDTRVQEQLMHVEDSSSQPYQQKANSALVIPGSCLRYSDNIPKCLGAADRCQIQNADNHLPTCTMNPEYIDKVMGCFQLFLQSSLSKEAMNSATIEVLRRANFCELLEAFLVQDAKVTGRQTLHQRLGQFHQHVILTTGHDDKRWLEDVGGSVRNPLVMIVYLLYRINRMVLTPKQYESLMDQCLLAPQSWNDFDERVNRFFAKTKRDAFVYSTIALVSMAAVFEFIVQDTVHGMELKRTKWPTLYAERKQVEQAAATARLQQQQQWLQKRFQTRVPGIRNLWKMLRDQASTVTSHRTIIVSTIPVLDHLGALTAVAGATKDMRDKLALLQTACSRDDSVERVRHPGLTALMFLASALEFTPDVNWSSFVERRGAASQDATKTYQFFVQPTFHFTVRLIEQWWARLCERRIVRQREKNDGDYHVEAYDAKVLELAVHSIAQVLDHAPPQTWRCRPYATATATFGAGTELDPHQQPKECPAFSSSETMCAKRSDDRCSFNRTATTRAACEFNPTWLDRCIQAIRLFTTRGDDVQGTLHHKLHRMNAWGVLLQLVAGDTFTDPDYRDRLFRELQTAIPNTLVVVLYRAHCANSHGFDKRFIADHDFIRPLASMIVKAVQSPGMTAYNSFFVTLDRLLPQAVPFAFDREKLQRLSFICELLVEAVRKQMSS